MINVLLGFLLAAAAIASPLVRGLTIGSAKIRLEETTFAAVARQLGEAPIARTGDAGDSRAQVCYATRGRRPTNYYLESSEMGGGESITQVDVVSAGSAPATEDPIIATRCVALAPGTADAKTDNGIMIGRRRREVEQRLHLRGHDSAGVTVYEKSEDRGTGSNAYNVSSWFRVRYTKGRVTAFSAAVVSSR
jgi:hypothetical protein